MNYQDYPKVLKHPAHRPAVVVKWDPKIKDPTLQQKGEPERFPDVIVHNIDQEQQYAAKGYKPNGVSDPEAYRSAMTGNQTRPAGSVIAYPKWLYRMVEGELESKLVQTEAEERALGSGWYSTPDKAREAPPEMKAKTKEPTALELGAAMRAAGEEKLVDVSRHKAPPSKKKAQSKQTARR